MKNYIISVEWTSKVNGDTGIELYKLEFSGIRGDTPAAEMNLLIDALNKQNHQYTHKAKGISNERYMCSASDVFDVEDSE